LIPLSDVFRAAYTDTDSSVTHSLSLRLEYQVGGYWVPCEGFTDFSEIYYSADYAAEQGDGKKLTTPEHIIAYIFWKQRLVFVKAAYFAQFCADAKGFGFTVYSFPSFGKEELCCEPECALPYPFSEITWIDDDFMDGDGSDFDFEAFRKIDAGTKYLNPKHFSVNQLLDYLLTPEMRLRIRRTQGEYYKY